MFDLLEREELPQIAEEGSEELFDYSEFAEEVQKKLGYDYLIGQQIREREKLQKQKRIREQNNDLIRAMKELDIRPFKEERVDEYKEKLKKKNTPSGDKVADVLILTAGFCAIFSIVSFFVGLISILFIGSAIPFWGCLGFLVAIALCITHDGFKSSYEIKWKEIDLQSYEKLIPEFVIQTALDLKEKCKFAEFSIEELRIKKSKKRFDPFLIVSIKDGPYYYIEVWNEPEFKQERVV